MNQQSQPPIVRVGIDASPLSYPPSGIRTYAEALLAHLSPESTGTAVTTLTPSTSRLNRVSGRAGRLWWDALGVAAASNDDVDLLHVLHGSAPIRSSTPLVVTLHDLIPLTDPVYRQSRGMKVYLSIMERTLQRADAVIVPSHYVASEAKRRWGWSSDRLHVIPMAVDAMYAPGDRSSELPASLRFLGIDRPYVFNVGGFDARKNLGVLLEAFARFQVNLPDSHQLVIAGAPHTGNDRVYPPVEPIIDRLGLRGRVILPGFVTDDVKVALYQNAAMYVTPSRNEGFGMTCLEAMACGAPVIAANRTSLPEITGDAAVPVEPEPGAVAQAMVEIAASPDAREEMRAGGIERAARFSWATTAAMTADVYREVLGNRLDHSSASQPR